MFELIIVIGCFAVGVSVAYVYRVQKKRNKLFDLNSGDIEMENID